MFPISWITVNNFFSYNFSFIYCYNKKNRINVCIINMYFTYTLIYIYLYIFEQKNSILKMQRLNLIAKLIHFAF